MRICFAVDDGPEAEAAFDCEYFCLNGMLFKMPKKACEGGFSRLMAFAFLFICPKIRY